MATCDRAVPKVGDRSTLENGPDDESGARTTDEQNAEMAEKSERVVGEDAQVE